MTSKVKAKQATHLKACILLYQMGALDDNLVPSAMSKKCEEVVTQANDVKKVGSNKRVRKFQAR